MDATRSKEGRMGKASDRRSRRISRRALLGGTTGACALSLVPRHVLG
jgi:hypothetical protein